MVATRIIIARALERSRHAVLMKRDVDQLTARTFDLLVVGGGIYGLIVAYDAAQRGLSVALIERADFGAATSFNHHRTLHGGLRYLQSLDVVRARESVRERRTFARIAPSAVRPIPFVLPLDSSLARGPLAMRMGFLLDRAVARDRNAGVPATHRLPAGQVLDPREATARFPALQGLSMTAAAVWHDYVTTEADRLTLSWGLAAVAHGATLANYVEGIALRLDGARAAGVAAIDRPSGRRLDIDARVVVNATGAAIDRLLATLSPPKTTNLPQLKAMNVVTSIEAPPYAIGARSSSGRNLFMVPWRNRALFGTWESSRPCQPEDLSVHEVELSAFITELQRAFPSFGLTRNSVTLVHRGVVPAVIQPGGRVALEGRDQVHDHAARGIEGIVSVAGTKYTTARAVAERVTDLVMAKLGRPPVRSRTSTGLLPILELTGDALLAHAAAHEMVVTLEDAVVRRTPLGALGRPGDEALGHAADVVGKALGWSEAKQTAEQQAVRRFYEDAAAT
jgi:glycerol-3-phosphate dehydrogenase